MTDAALHAETARAAGADQAPAARTFHLTRDMVEAAVILAGSALMALSGVALAEYLMLPFGA